MPVYVVPLANLQDPITQAMLVGDGDVLRFEQTLKRGLVGVAEIEVRNPGLRVLNQLRNLAVVETPTGLLADAVVLCRARIARIPDDLGSRTIRLVLECAPASWKQDLRAAANASVAGAGIPVYKVPVIPDPGVGVVAVGFARSVGAPWSAVRDNAVAATAFFQTDLQRQPFSSLYTWQVLTATNALLTVTVPDTPAVRDAARYGSAVLIGISGDKNPRNAVLYAAGAAAGRRPAPGGMVDLTVNLAAVNLSAAGIAPKVRGDQTALGLPYFDPLLPGSREDLTTGALEARSETWYLDPVTHKISLDDFTKGGRVVDLGDLGDHGTETRTVVAAGPARTVKLRLICEFSQTAFGVCNVAPWVSQFAGSYGTFTTLTLPAQGTGIPASASGGDLNFGWGDRGPIITTGTDLSAKFLTGRSFEVTYRDNVHHWVPYTDEYGQARLRSSWELGRPYVRRIDESAHFVVYSVDYVQWLKTFSFSQLRRETVDLILDVPAQPFAVQGEPIVDLGVMQLADVNGIEGALPYAEGIAYNRGDRVLFKGRLYECMADNVVSLFVNTVKVVNGIPQVTQTTPYWRDLGAGTPMPDPRLPSYFDTGRGRGTIETALNRMRATALQRLSCLHYGKSYAWSDARTVQLTDEVRALFRDGAGPLAVRGKVEEIRRVIVGEGPSYIHIVTTPMIGTGRNDRLTPKKTAYVGSGYVAPRYTNSNKPLYVTDSTPGRSVSGTVGTDVEYVLTSSTLFEPVQALRLSDPSYSVLSVKYRNPAETQIARSRARIAANRSPDRVTQEYPTTLDVAMRPLRTEGNIPRNYVCHALLTVSPRGVDNINGGEP